MPLLGSVNLLALLTSPQVRLDHRYNNPVIMVFFDVMSDHLRLVRVRNNLRQIRLDMHYAGSGACSNSSRARSNRRLWSLQRPAKSKPGAGFDEGQQRELTHRLPSDVDEAGSWAAHE